MRVVTAVPSLVAPAPLSEVTEVFTPPLSSTEAELIALRPARVASEGLHLFPAEPPRVDSVEAYVLATEPQGASTVELPLVNSMPYQQTVA